ncbi:MAG: hypothetical protein M1379_16620 [Firmicutes bacterium]|nr:hypothetical protein [Bacillota bacterium]
MDRWLFPLLASLLSAIFAYFLGQQYRERKKPHQLTWLVSFLVFSFAAFAEFYSEVWGWNAGLYRFYYVAAASLVAFMAAGTVYLFSRRAGHLFVGAVVLVTLVMLYRSLTAPINVGAFVPGVTVAGKAMPNSVRIFSPLLTVPSSLILIFGAIISWAKAGAWYNLLIAAGTLIIAGSGSAARFGVPRFLYLGEMLGLAVIFAGFMKSREVIRARDGARQGKA